MELKFREARSLHHIMKNEKVTFNLYIYTSFLDCFSVLFVKIRCELSDIRDTERLFSDKFGHDVQQPPP